MCRKHLNFRHEAYALVAEFMKGFTFIEGGADHKMEVIMTAVGWDIGRVSSKKNKSKRSQCLKFKYFGTGTGREYKMGPSKCK